MTVEWTKAATKQLEAAHDYVWGENRSAADRLLLQIMDSIENLISHPPSGREGRVKGTRELVILNTPFVVAYRIYDEAIQILAVIHGKRRWPTKF